MDLRASSLSLSKTVGKGEIAHNQHLPSPTGFRTLSSYLKLSFANFFSLESLNFFISERTKLL